MEVMTETPSLHHVHQPYQARLEYTWNDVLNVSNQWNALYFSCQDGYTDFEAAKQTNY